MRQHLDTLRFLLTELFIFWAIRVVPKHTIEARELAIFVTHSWISRPGGQFVSTNRSTVSKVGDRWQK